LNQEFVAVVGISKALFAAPPLLSSA